MEASIQKLAALVFFVIGVSHVARPREWVEFFIAVRGRGAVGSFINAFVHFPLGVVIVAFHNVWTWPAAVLTVCGWGLVFKGFLYFVFTGYGERMLSRVTVERAWQFRVAGVFALALSAFSLYLFTRG